MVVQAKAAAEAAAREEARLKKAQERAVRPGPGLGPLTLSAFRVQACRPWTRAFKVFQAQCSLRASL